ncbi:MAG TPA: putative glycoside hydrolase, partial [Desulfobacterales bacterium]|nr:putative glycoside hydrolase [Desulfobacterales bacterium]
MQKTIRKLFWAAALVIIFPVAGLTDGGHLLKVVDHHTGQAIAEAVVTLDGESLNPAPQGLFPLTKAGGTVKARAHGYQRAELALTDPLPAGPLEVKLSPFTPKALYLSFYGVGSKALRGPAMKLIEETELNALVIDVKGDRGMIPYRSSVPLATEVGGQKIITVRDAEGLMALFKERGVYTIARIVVFKDNLLASARPDLAVKTPSGEPWRDRESLAWVDPFRKEVWDYNIQIAVEAAKLGFDEIQFDYVRFPDSHSPRFSQPSTEEARVKAIAGFLQEARSKLAPYNVFTAADIFGYVCWNLNDTDIGQKLDPIASTVDYLSPMLYPSGFQFGIPGFRNPVQNPYEIVYLSLKKAQERTKISPLRFRPWLQAFKDYAFDRRQFNGKELRDQISASEKFGSQGWMLWNPVNQYTAAA